MIRFAFSRYSPRQPLHRAVQAYLLGLARSIAPKEFLAIPAIAAGIILKLRYR